MEHIHPVINFIREQSELARAIILRSWGICAGEVLRKVLTTTKHRTEQVDRRKGIISE